MEYRITSRGAEIYAPVEFDLKNTFECGQCFRWMPDEDNAYSAVVCGRYIRVFREGDMVIIDGSDEETFHGIWRSYFDIDTDYELLRQEMIELCPQLGKAAEKINGIRILRQSPWEALCSFIISQNNNIPRIQGIVSRLCENFGEDTGHGYTFPDAKVLAVLEPDDLAPLRAGFRARYIIDAARKCADGRVDLEKLKDVPTDEAREQLMTIVGVGNKVADCTMLYGLHKMDAFPIDVWMKKALENEFAGISPKDLGHTAGIAQQYIFHYTRNAV